MGDVLNPLVPLAAAEPYVARPDIDAELGAWLSDPNAPPFFHLVGSPGAGKTSWAAAICRDLATPSGSSIVAYHFCRRQQAASSSGILYLQKTASQIAKTKPPFAKALLETASHRGDIRIEISQSAESSQSIQQTGVAITNLFLNAPSAADLVEPVLLEPLRRTAGQRMTPWLMVVDALDEADRSNVSGSVRHLLLSLGDLPQRVKVVITSRPDRFLERDLDQRGTRRFNLDLEPEPGAVRCFVINELGRRQLAQRLEAGFSFEQLVNILAGKAGRNFLLARCSIETLSACAGLIDRAEAAKLPSNLTEYYLAYLTAEFGALPEVWHDRISPVAGVLSLAREPLDETQLAAITGLPVSEIRDAVRRLRPFLVAQIAPGGRMLLRLYHQSFSDFLGSRDEAEEFWLPPTEQHRVFANWALSGGWSAPDGYGARHAIVHILAAKFEDRLEKLTALFDAGFLSQRHASGDHPLRMVEDLRRCVADARESHDAQQLLKFSLCLLFWQDRAAQKSDPGSAIVLAAIGRTDEAIELFFSSEASGPVPDYERNSKNADFAQGLAALGLIGAAIRVADRSPEEAETKRVLLAALEGFALTDVVCDGHELIERVSMFASPDDIRASPAVCHALAKNPLTADLAMRLAGNAPVQIAAVWTGTARYDLPRVWEATEYLEPFQQDIGGERLSIDRNEVRLRLLSEYSTELERGRHALHLAVTQVLAPWDFPQGILFVGKLAALDAELAGQAWKYVDGGSNAVVTALAALHFAASGAPCLSTELTRTLPEDLLKISGSAKWGLMASGSYLRRICVTLALIDLQPPAAPAAQNLLERFAAAMLRLLEEYPDRPEFKHDAGPVLGRMFAIAGDSFLQVFHDRIATRWANNGGYDAAKPGVAAGLALRYRKEFQTRCGSELYKGLDVHAATLAAAKVLAYHDPDTALALYHGISKRYYATRDAVAGMIACTIRPAARSMLVGLLSEDSYGESATFVDAIADLRRGLAVPFARSEPKTSSLMDAVSKPYLTGVARLHIRSALKKLPRWTETIWNGTRVSWEERRRSFLKTMAQEQFDIALEIANEAGYWPLVLEDLRVAVGAWIAPRLRNGGGMELWDELLAIGTASRGETETELLKLAAAVELSPFYRAAARAEIAKFPLLTEAFDLLVGNPKFLRKQDETDEFFSEIFSFAAKGNLIRDHCRHSPIDALYRASSLAESELEAESLIKILFDVWPLPDGGSAAAALEQFHEFAIDQFPQDKSMEWRIVTDARKRFSVRIAPWAPVSAIELVRAQADFTREGMIVDVIEAAMAVPADGDPDFDWWSKIASAIEDESKRAEAFNALIANARANNGYAAVAMPPLIGELAMGARRSFLRGLHETAQLAAAAAPAKIPDMLEDVTRVALWFCNEARV